MKNLSMKMRLLYWMFFLAFTVVAIFGRVRRRIFVNKGGDA
jgi:hypothetical protein